jgi:hypothetical protein
MSVRSLSAALSAVLLTALAAGASLAQSRGGGTSETGTLITRRPAEIHGETQLHPRLALEQFAACVIRRTPAASQRAIDLPVDTGEFDRTIRRLAECLAAGGLKLPRPLLRGAIFEALYLRDFGRDAKPDFKSVPTFNYAQGYTRPLSPAAQDAVGLAVVADCVARTSPVAAHELVTSIPGSPLEDRAMGAVARQLPGCVPPQRTFRFSRSVVRGAMAEALYRLSSQTGKAARS